jgi:hypothetical protein
MPSPKTDAFEQGWVLLSMTPHVAVPGAEANTPAASLFPARVSQHAHVAFFDLSRCQLPHRA